MSREAFPELLCHQIMIPLSKDLYIEREKVYVEHVYDKIDAMLNCTRFVEGKVLGISFLRDYVESKVM